MHIYPHMTNWLMQADNSTCEKTHTCKICGLYKIRIYYADWENISAWSHIEFMQIWKISADIRNAYVHICLKPHMQNPHGQLYPKCLYIQNKECIIGQTSHNTTLLSTFGGWGLKFYHSFSFFFQFCMYCVELEAELMPPKGLSIYYIIQSWGPGRPFPPIVIL